MSNKIEKLVEIKPIEALKHWNTKSIFAIDKNGVDRQINHDKEYRSAYYVVDEAVQEGCKFFID